jgi:hypothetical protein
VAARFRAWVVKRMDSSGLSQIDGNLIDGLQFCAHVYKLFENIRATEDGRSRLRMRASDVEKKLVEELLPICKYVQTKYRAGRYLSVKWVDGNQRFDAEVRQSGGHIDLGHYPSDAYLEVTCVMHPNDYLSRELLDSGGVAFGIEGIRRVKKTREIRSQPIVRNNMDFIDAYCPLVLGQITKKAGIDYPAQTTLIVQCSLNRLYTSDEWGALVVKVRDGLPEHKFREIFMFDVVSEYDCSFYGPQG